MQPKVKLTQKNWIISVTNSNLSDYQLFRAVSEKVSAGYKSARISRIEDEIELNGRK